MSTKLLLVSTCGTSLLTNRAPDDLRRWLVKIANMKDLPAPDAERLAAHTAERRALLEDANDEERRRLSAELNGIMAVLQRWRPRQVLHFLVHTDTAAGGATADLVRRVLHKDGHAVEFLTASGLRTNDPLSFREALADITKQFETCLPGYRRDNWMIVFNLTGGFKAINAYLQALGMLYADRCVFIFERQHALMEIPRLPVKLSDADEVREHLTVFRRLAWGYPVALEEVAGIPDALLLVDEGQVTTSVWGDVVWQRVRKQLLSEELVPPLSDKLRISKAIHMTFADLPTDRRVHVNDALDALSAFLDGVRKLPQANTFKKLQGNPRPPSTHELYLWSDGAAWRLFGHFEGSVFVADSIGPHL